jgi:hypothetical protein
MEYDIARNLLCDMIIKKVAFCCYFTFLCSYQFFLHAIYTKNKSHEILEVYRLRIWLQIVCNALFISRIWLQIVCNALFISRVGEDVRLCLTNKCNADKDTCYLPYTTRSVCACARARELRKVICHSEDRASWYILIIKPRRCTNLWNLFLK